MRYSYDRTADSSFAAYGSRLEALQSTYVGEVAERVYEYIKMLHNRLGNTPDFENISGFLSWDYGSPKQLGPGKWSIRVWQKSASTYPDDLNPNILVTVELEDNGKVRYEAKAGSELLIAATQSSASSRGVGMAIGEAWEKRITGSVDYGRFASERMAGGKVVEVDKAKKQLGTAADDLVQMRGRIQELQELLGGSGPVAEVDKAKKQLGTAADELIRMRGEIRDLRSLLGDIQFDDSGKVYTNNVDNPVLKKLRDELRDLEDALGLSSQLDYVRERVLPAPALKLQDQLRDLDRALEVSTQLEYVRNRVLPSLLVKNATDSADDNTAYSYDRV